MIILLLGGVTDASAMTKRVVIRDNHLNFKVPNSKFRLQNGTFTIEQLKVTPGQPFSNISRGKEKYFGSNGDIVFHVGRHGSTEVANWFKNKVSASHTTFGHNPGKLNFAFTGTLKLALSGDFLGGSSEEYIFRDIALAQGHAGTSNNWWFGGKNCQNSSKNRVVCQGENSHGERVIFEFRRGGNKVNVVDVNPIRIMQTTDWMSELAANTLLSEIIMPGSHDAGMSVAHNCGILDAFKNFVLTQEKSVGDQLRDGARYFDIRLDYKNGKLVTYHRTGAFGCDGEDFDTILQDTKEFLAQYPSEVVLMKISHIRYDSQEVKEKIDDLLKRKYADLLYKHYDNSINLAYVTLEEARGKMITLLDYPEFIDVTEGNFYYRDGIFDSSKFCDLEETNTSSHIVVCDKYSNTDQYDLMKNDQVEKWEKNALLGDKKFTLLSWTLTPKALLGVRELAQKANDGLSRVLYNEIINKNQEKPNIIYLDYINIQTTQNIIRYNFID